MPTGDTTLPPFNDKADLVAENYAIRHQLGDVQGKLKSAYYEAERWEKLARDVSNQLLSERQKVAMLIEIVNETRDLRKALAAIRMPIQTLARHADRCAAKEICDDHAHMWLLAKTMNRHIAHFSDHNDLGFELDA